MPSLQASDPETAKNPCVCQAAGHPSRRFCRFCSKAAVIPHPTERQIDSAIILVPKIEGPDQLVTIAHAHREGMHTFARPSQDWSILLFRTGKRAFVELRPRLL